MGFFVFFIICLCIIGGIFYYYIRKAIIGVNYLKNITVKKEELTSEKLINIINRFVEHFEARLLTDKKILTVNNIEDNLDIEVICKQTNNIIFIDINNISQGYLLFKKYMSIGKQIFSEDELIQALNEWNKADSDFKATAQLKNDMICLCLEHQYIFSDCLSSKDLCAELIEMNGKEDWFTMFLNKKNNVLKYGDEEDEEDDDDDIELPINKITRRNIIKLIDKEDFLEARPFGDASIQICCKKWQLYFFVNLSYLRNDYLLLEYVLDIEKIKKKENIRKSVFDDELESIVDEFNDSRNLAAPKAYYDREFFSLVDKLYFSDSLSKSELNYHMFSFAYSVNEFLNKYQIEKMIMESK